jgi:hypothetical protein
MIARLREKTMIERDGERRVSTSWFSSLTHDRRRQGYDRRGQPRINVAPGLLRPGFAESMPPVDRRKVLTSDLE